MHSLWTHAKRRLHHLIKPELDSSRVKRLHHHFNEACRYREYLERCQAITLEKPPTALARTVLEQGFEYLCVIDKDRAAQLCQTMIADAQPKTFRKNAGLVERFRLCEALENELLETVFSSTLEQKIRAYFGSEFFVHWLTVTRALPARDQTRNSFLWHCDRGPQSHLKLLIYLNGTQEHGGNTVFVDLETTTRMAVTGYLFGRVDDRCADLGPLARDAGIALHPVAREIAAGEGILFQPTGVLHRGLLPVTAPRYVATLCLLPSPIPWQDARARGAGTDQATDDKWYDNALDLWQRLAPDTM